MRQSLARRLVKLEAKSSVQISNGPPGSELPCLPPGFWAALCGALPADQVAPQTRNMINQWRIGLERPERPDPYEERIRLAGMPASSPHAAEK
jgi:hypothetical protein